MKKKTKNIIRYIILTIVIVHHNKLRPEMLLLLNIILYTYIVVCVCVCVCIKQYILLLVGIYRYVYNIIIYIVPTCAGPRTTVDEYDKIMNARSKKQRARTIISSVCHSDLSENAGTAGYNIYYTNVYIENIIIY